MKIGVNARFLAKPFTGIGQHTQNLFQNLAEQNPNDEFILVTAEDVSKKVSFPKNVKVFFVPEKFPGTAGMKKTYWEQVQVPGFFKKMKVNLVHFPYPSNPWNGFNKPVFVTVHDTIPWTQQEYRKSFLTRIYQDRCRDAVAKADHVFTVSEASLKEIYKTCHVSKTKLSVTHNGISANFSKKSTEHERKTVLGSYGFNPDRKYLFYIGGYDARKNVELLVKVFNEKIAPFYDIDLVLAGGKSLQDSLYKSFDELTKSMDQNSLKYHKGKLMTTGFVPEKDLPALYQSAFAFISLSGNEGCNLPLLEAVASGVPVIASDIPVHHEMLGNVGLFCSLDEKAVADKLIHLLTNEDFYKHQKQKVADHKIPFSWEKTAQEVMKVYKKFV